MKHNIQIAPPLSVEAYIQSELHAELRHEYINGQLIEMPGKKDINNQIAGLIYVFLFTQLKSKGYQLYMNDVKVGVPDGTKYFYPDVFITREQRTEQNQYIKSLLSDKILNYSFLLAIPLISLYLKLLANKQGVRLY